MKEPWQAFLQLGVVHYMAFPECLAGEGPQFDTLKEICHDPFFEAVCVGPIADAANHSRYPVNLSQTFGRFRIASFGTIDVAMLVRHVDSPVYAMRLT